MGRANFCSLSQVNIDADGNCRDYNPLRNLSQNAKKDISDKSEEFAIIE